MKIDAFGIDLAKDIFQIHGVDDHGKMVLRRNLDRSKTLEFLSNCNRARKDGRLWQRALLGTAVGCNGACG